MNRVLIIFFFFFFPLPRSSLYFCFLPFAISFLLWEATIPLTVKITPPSLSLIWGFCHPFFPDICQSCQLGWLRHSCADPLSSQTESSSRSSSLHHVAKQHAYWKGFFSLLLLLFGQVNFLLHCNHFKHTFMT